MSAALAEPLPADFPEPPAEPDPAPADDGADASAPWGRRQDGSPKRRPGRRPKAETRRPPGAPPASRPPRGPGGKFGSSRPDYRATIRGLVQSAATSLFVAGQVRRSVPLLADSATLTNAAPELAEIGQTIAANDARAAAWLERLSTVGPWSLAVTAVVTLGAQLAVNHRVLPVGLFGTKDPADLVRGMGFDVQDQGPAPEPEPEPAPAPGFASV